MEVEDSSSLPAELREFGGDDFDAEGVARGFFAARPARAAAAREADLLRLQAIAEASLQAAVVDNAPTIVDATGAIRAVGEQIATLRAELGAVDGALASLEAHATAATRHASQPAALAHAWGHFLDTS